MESNESSTFSYEAAQANITDGNHLDNTMQPEQIINPGMVNYFELENDDADTSCE